MDLIDNIKGLKKFFGLAAQYKEIPKAEILSSNEALKAFGRLWSEHPEDVMMMMTIVEQEFAARTAYSPDEMGLVKRILSDMIKFLQGCSKEWQEYEYKQRQQVKKNVL